MYVKGTFQEQKSYVALPVFGKVFLRLREAPAVRLLPCTSRPSLWSWFANADTGCEVDSRIWHFFAIFRHMLEFTHFYHPEIPKHADLSSFFLSISTLPQETWWVHSKNHVPARCRSLNSDRIGRNWAKTNGFVWIGGPPKSKMSSSSFFNISHEIAEEIPWKSLNHQRTSTRWVYHRHHQGWWRPAKISATLVQWDPHSTGASVQVPRIVVVALGIGESRVPDLSRGQKPTNLYSWGSDLGNWMNIGSFL